LWRGSPKLQLGAIHNERGKGDHKHVGEQELPYEFVSVAQLRADFLQEVKRWNEH
jgi:hypothetical protein